MPCVFCRRASAALNAVNLAVTVSGFHHLSGKALIAFAALVIIAFLIATAALASACRGMPALATSRKDRSLNALTYGLILGAAVSLDAAASNHLSGPTMILYMLGGAMVAGLIFTIVGYVWTFIRTRDPVFSRR